MDLSLSEIFQNFQHAIYHNKFIRIFCNGFQGNWFLDRLPQPLKYFFRLSTHCKSTLLHITVESLNNWLITSSFCCFSLFLPKSSAKIYCLLSLPLGQHLSFTYTSSTYHTLNGCNHIKYNLILKFVLNVDGNFR